MRHSKTPLAGKVRHRPGETPDRSQLGSQTSNDSKVAFVELFFDLMFIFAITQLSTQALGLGVIASVILILVAMWVRILRNPIAGLKGAISRHSPRTCSSFEKPITSRSFL
jgi:hypothetical protein